MLALVLLAALLLAPGALALDQEEVLESQRESLGLEDLEQAGEEYTGEADLGKDLDVAGIFRNLAQQVKDKLVQVVKTAGRSCVLLLAITLLCGLAEGLGEGGGGDPL